MYGNEADVGRQATALVTGRPIVLPTCNSGGAAGGTAPDGGRTGGSRQQGAGWRLCRAGAQRCKLRQPWARRGGAEVLRAVHCAHAVRRAVAASGVPRGEVFLTTKLWTREWGYDKARAAIQQSLQVGAVVLMRSSFFLSLR